MFALEVRRHAHIGLDRWQIDLQVRSAGVTLLRLCLWLWLVLSLGEQEVGLLGYESQEAFVERVAASQACRVKFGGSCLVLLALDVGGRRCRRNRCAIVLVEYEVEQALAVEAHRLVD